MLASDRTGTTTTADAHGYRDFAGALVVRKVCPDADTATSDWDYGNRNHTAAPAPRNAGSGSGSQRLDYDSVFLVWQTGSGVGRYPELDETFPYMLPTSPARVAHFTSGTNRTTFNASPSR